MSELDSINQDLEESSGFDSAPEDPTKFWFNLYHIWHGIRYDGFGLRVIENIIATSGLSDADRSLLTEEVRFIRLLLMRRGYGSIREDKTNQLGT